MKLRGQGRRGEFHDFFLFAGSRRREVGYAMAALLVGMSIAAVMLTVAMPVWKQMSQREKEEELVFRGQQYVHALRLFSRKYANASPPNLDVLVEQRFLRKKYKDPITNDDFQPVLVGQAGTAGLQGLQGRAGFAGRSGAGAGAAGASAAGAGAGAASTLPGAPAQPAGGRGTSSLPGGGRGGIIGVASKSKDKSIRIYNGRDHYNEWAFINTPALQPTGAPGAGPGQRGGRQGQRGEGPLGGPRGRGPGGRQGPGQPPTGPTGPQRGPGGFSPFQPGQPIQPIQPGRGRGE